MTTRRYLTAPTLLVLALLAGCGGSETPRVELDGNSRVGVVSAENGAGTKISAPARYVAGPDLVEIEGPAPVWRVESAWEGSRVRRADQLTRVLGLKSPLHEDSSGWVSEGADAALSVVKDATLSFSYTRVLGPVSGGAASAPCHPTAAATCAQIVSPGEPPSPPVGVPGEAEARRLATGIFEKMGHAPRRLEVYADAYGAQVRAVFDLDGLDSPLTWTVGYGAGAEISWMSGHLAELVRDGEMEREGSISSVDRLGDWRFRALGAGTAPAVPITSTRVSGEGVTPEPGRLGGGIPVPGSITAETCTPDGSEGLVAEPAPVTCPPASEQDGGREGDDQVVQEPVVEVTGVEAAVGLFLDTDAIAWILPAYTYTSRGGVVGTVLAVREDRITLPAEPDATPGLLEPPVGAVPVQPGAPGGEPEPWPPAAEVRDLVGLSEKEASSRAAGRGLTVRVIARDGEELMATADYSTTRVNLRLEDGVVVDATIG